MKTIKIANKEYVFIQIPDDAYDFRKKLSYEGGYWLAMFEPRIAPYLAIQSVRIEGNSFCKFKIITTTNSITEEIAKSVVEYKYLKNKPFIAGREYWYKSYTYVRKGWEFSFHTALESFYSLMKSLELDRKSKNYLLIEKI